MVLVLSPPSQLPTSFASPVTRYISRSDPIPLDFERELGMNENYRTISYPNEPHFGTGEQSMRQKYTEEQAGQNA